MSPNRAFQLTLLALVGLTSGIVAAPVDPTEFEIVIHPDNPVESLTREEASRIFLKKNGAWPDGRTILPVDQSPDASIRGAFSMEIHGRSVKAILAYWRQKVFSGRAVPPPHEGSDQEVLRYIEANPLAIGYVSKSARTIRVKTLRIVE